MNWEKTFRERAPRLGLSACLGLMCGIFTGLVGLLVGNILSKILLNEFDVYFDLAVPLSVLCSTISSILCMFFVSIALPGVSRFQRVLECFIASLPLTVIWLVITPFLGMRGLEYFFLVLFFYMMGCGALTFPLLVPEKKDAVSG